MEKNSTSAPSLFHETTKKKPKKQSTEKTGSEKVGEDNFRSSPTYRGRRERPESVLASKLWGKDGEKNLESQKNLIEGENLRLKKVRGVPPHREDPRDH